MHSTQRRRRRINFCITNGKETSVQSFDYINLISTLSLVSSLECPKIKGSRGFYLIDRAYKALHTRLRKKP